MGEVIDRDPRIRELFNILGGCLQSAVYSGCVLIQPKLTSATTAVLAMATQARRSVENCILVIVCGKAG